ncbi:MAG TPA: hypothetical protein VGF48_06115 [Thermoanaerobaculia bacterium]
MGVHCDQNVLACSSAVQGAAQMWNGCAESGDGFPTINAGGTGDVSIAVEVRDQNSPLSGGGCGVFAPIVSGNRVVGGRITVYTRRSDGSSCAPLDKTIAHEIGHALGFDDSGCNDGRIMSGRPAQDDYRTVKADECAAADDRWTTPTESGGGACVTNCDNQNNANCPLVLDLNGDGILTTDSSQPVRFDLDADGIAERITWTNPQTEEGFLWIDSIPNGRVDDGSELFGVGTTLPSGAKAPDGFAALEVYDTVGEGGDGDGRITVNDHVWGRLRIWVDANHDGISQVDEVAPLHRAGVVEIDLRYRFDPLPDASGNYHFLRGTYLRRVPPRDLDSRAIDDVFFRRVP